MVAGSVTSAGSSIRVEVAVGPASAEAEADRTTAPLSGQWWRLPGTCGILLCGIAWWVATLPNWTLGSKIWCSPQARVYRTPADLASVERSCQNLSKMPWRLLGVRRAASLELAEGGHPEWLLLRGGSREVAVMPVLRREGGLLLAMAVEALTEQERADQKMEGLTDDLGPTKIVAVDGLPEDEEEEPGDVAMVLVDWPQSLYKFLRTAGGAEPAWPEATIWPQYEDNPVCHINTDQLGLLAREWVQTQESALSESYATAVEPSPAPVRSTGQKDTLQQLLQTVTALQADLADLKAGRDLGAAPSGALSSGQPSGALAKAQALVGPPPRSAALPRPAVGAPLLDCGVPAAAGTGLRVEDVEEEAEAEPTTDSLLRTALVSLLSQQSKKKKSKAPGLPLQAMSDSEGEEESDPLRKLTGARGTMLAEKLRMAMEADPRAYIASIETNAAHLLGEQQATGSTMERYAKEQLPLGSERSLGYMTWAIARCLTLLKAGESDKCHLLLLLLMAAVEQYKLDSNWVAAWRITQLTQPPFAEWKSREFALPQLRQDHAHSRLIHPTWAAAIIARLKDEETLLKRRSVGEDWNRGWPNRPNPRGRGRGRGGQDANEKTS